MFRLVCRLALSLALVLTTLTLVTPCSAAAADSPLAPPAEGSICPGAATGAARSVTRDERDALQSLLDCYKWLRLDADTDYRSGAVPLLTVSSGERIEAGWHTLVPPIWIPGGSHDIVLDDILSESKLAPEVTFGPGPETTRVRIVGGTGRQWGTGARIQIRSGAHVSHLELTEFVRLDVQQREHGWVRDSLFSHFFGYGPGRLVEWYGNRQEPSSGNAFMFVGLLTPFEPSRWVDAGDLWFFQWGAESWDASRIGTVTPFIVEGSSRINSISLIGGTSHTDIDGAMARYVGAQSVVSWYADGSGGRLDHEAVERLDHVQDMLTFESIDPARLADVDPPPHAGRVRVADSIDHPTRSAISSIAGISRAELPQWLTDRLLGPPRTGELERPEERRAPSWSADVAEPSTAPDSRARIQSLIDRDGIARLAAGTYYLDGPLKLGRVGRVEGVLGAGVDEVRLVARGAFPLFEGRGDFLMGPARKETFITLALEGLTLQGGTIGLDFSSAPGNLGAGGGIAWSTFAHLRFEGQSVAGVRADHIFGFDNNFWYRVDFANMPTAISGFGRAYEDGLNYADKQFFFECQFTDIKGAAWDWNANRWSGGNLWERNFYRNVGSISRVRSGINLGWVNCVFENITGPIAFKTEDDASTTSRFLMVIDSVFRGRGPPIVADHYSSHNGMLFVDTEFAQDGGSIVNPEPSDVILFAWNSRMTGSARLGSVAFGVFINSKLGPIGHQFEVIDDKGPQILVSRPSRPYPQVLPRPQ